MKIYTKTGDQGETGLLGGVRISKSSVVVEVTGLLDETNSLLGLAVSQNGPSDSAPEEVKAVVQTIQHDLFDLGSRVAGCLSNTKRTADFPVQKIRQLEDWIDDFDGRLPAMTAFILPGGCFAGGLLHQTRAICRRTERELVKLINADLDWPVTEPAGQRLSDELVYLNRLSDLLFVLARFVNQQAGCSETKWLPNSNDA